MENNQEVKNEQTTNTTNAEEESVATNCKKIDVNENLTKIKDDIKETEFGVLTHPSNTNMAYNKTFEKLGQDQKKLNDTKYTNNEQITLVMGANSINATTKNDVLVNNINNDKTEYVNDISYGDVELNTRNVGIKVKDGMSNAALALKLKTKLGIGEIIQVPLWHSGFWVTIAPINQKELINLSIAINDSQIALGRSTNSLIYSNYSIVFIKILTDFIIEHITDASLTLKDEDDIRDYILLPDLYLLINGLISSLYPMGIDLIKGCYNTTVLDPETNKPKCDYIVEGKVDTKKLLWVNRKALTKKMLNQMCSRRPRSVTTNDALEYQKSLTQLQDEWISLEQDGFKIEMLLHTPNLSEAIDSGVAWVESVIKQLEGLFKENDSDIIKQEKTTDMLVAIKANVYKHYIKEIKFDSVSTTDSVTIEEYLEIISLKRELVNRFLLEVTKYINNGAIAIIATPNYICPVCQKDQAELKGEFKEFIPLNVLESFFDLSDLRIKRLRENGIY